MPKFLVEEILNFEFLDVIVHILSLIEGFQPVLPVVCLLFRECQVKTVFILFIFKFKLYLVLSKVRKILFGLGTCGSAQAFVVLYFPVDGSSCFPDLVVPLTEEIFPLVASAAADYWGDKFFEESGYFA